jgi:AcrR family transcriptional regulator
MGKGQATGDVMPAAGGAPETASPALSRERIAEAALGFLDRHSLDELSMRRLAAELGVGTMTLYGYFRSKEELLDAVSDLTFDRVALPPAEGSWREQIREVVMVVHRTLAHHPAAARIRAERPILTPGALRITEAALKSLREAGFGAEDAAGAVRLVFTYLFGFATFNPARSTADARAQATNALAALPMEDFPEMLAIADQAVAAMGGEKTFERGLDLILDGLEARLASS